VERIKVFQLETQKSELLQQVAASLAVQNACQELVSKCSVSVTGTYVNSGTGFVSGQVSGTVVTSGGTFTGPGVDADFELQLLEKTQESQDRLEQNINITTMCEKIKVACPSPEEPPFAPHQPPHGACRTPPPTCGFSLRVVPPLPVPCTLHPILITDRARGGDRRV